jgi:hypothetical protein
MRKSYLRGWTCQARLTTWQRSVGTGVEMAHLNGRRERSLATMANTGTEVRLLRHLSALCIAASCGFGSPVVGQQIGEIQTFGPNGRLYSRDRNEHYLLSRQAYGTEDSVGYRGQIRLVIHRDRGGYEILTRDYVARCRAGDEPPSVATYEQGREEETSNSTRIGNANRPPSVRLKNAYNLFWAACYGQYRKFK